MKISIITVCYNSEKTIEQTFNSILSQTKKGFEYIVIDGCSTDGTLNAIKKYDPIFKNNNIDFKYISEPDNGIYDAMNKGIKLASGNVIGMINSDDCYKNNTIEVVEKWFESNPQTDVMHGILHNISHGSTVSYVGTSSSNLKKGMIQHPTCFVKKEKYSLYGLFDTSYRYAADYELLLRFQARGAQFNLVPYVLAEFDENGAGNCKKSRLEALDIKKKYSLVNHKQYLISYLKILVRGNR